MPRYIFHADGDNFFASCLVARNPKYKNKPLVVGEERGMATAMSTEAKAIGVTRGMPIFEIRKKFKDVIIMKGDYPLFDQVSSRMHKLISDTSACIEKYSVDESFADISDAILKRKSTPEIIGMEIKTRLESQLGVTFSIGIAPTKTLSKLAGSSQKPNGFTVAMTEEKITPILQKTPIEKVWGIGSKTAVKLRVHGVYTALDLRDATPSFISQFSKPISDIQKELKGIIVHNISLTKSLEQSMISSESFRTTDDKKFIKSELVRHIHIISSRLRHHESVAKVVSIYVKNKSGGIKLCTSTLLNHDNNPSVFLEELDKVFPQIFQSGDMIRTTGISVCNIIPSSHRNESLFDTNRNKENNIFKTIDALGSKGLKIVTASYIK